MSEKVDLHTKQVSVCLLSVPSQTQLLKAPACLGRGVNVGVLTQERKQTDPPMATRQAPGSVHTDTGTVLWQDPGLLLENAFAWPPPLSKSCGMLSSIHSPPCQCSFLN